MSQADSGRNKHIDSQKNLLTIENDAAEAQPASQTQDTGVAADGSAHLLVDMEDNRRRSVEPIDDKKIEVRQPFIGEEGQK